jgi:hypothetical protein
VLILPGENTLCINHYRFQSAEVTLGIKERRGGGNQKARYTLSANLFGELIKKDLPVTLDDTLSRICEERGMDMSMLSTTTRPRVELYPDSSWMKLLPYVPSLAAMNMPCTSLAELRVRYRELLDAVQSAIAGVPLSPVPPLLLYTSCYSGVAPELLELW